MRKALIIITLLCFTLGMWADTVAGTPALPLSSDELDAVAKGMLIVIIGLSFVLIPCVLASLVFTVFYVFNYQGLRKWFDKRCGVECIPHERLNSMIRKPLEGVLIMFVLNLVVKFIVNPMDPSIFKSILSSAVLLGLIAIPCIYLRNLWKKYNARYGKRAARWIIIYCLMVIAAFYVLVSLFIILIALMLAIYVASAVADYSLKPGGPVHGGNCANCSKFGQSSCPHRDRAGGSGVCSAHEF